MPSQDDFFWSLARGLGALFHWPVTIWEFAVGGVFYERCIPTNSVYFSLATAMCQHYLCFIFLTHTYSTFSLNY
jgi:hypothetical protein